MSNDSLNRFAIALHGLLTAARNYLGTEKTEDDLARIQSLFAEVQLTVPVNVTISPFRREIWPLEGVTYDSASIDGGKTWQPWPQYHTIQRGNREARMRWIAELEGIAEAVLRQISMSVTAEDSSKSISPQAAPKGKAIKDTKTEARDEWIYKKCCKGVPHSQIVTELKRKAAKHGWRIVSSKQRIYQIGNEYADRHELDRPPPRQNL